MKLTPLTEIDPEAHRAFGGKAVGLARLCRNGFQTPKAFVLPCKALFDFLAENQIKEGETKRQDILKGGFTAEMTRAVLDASNRLGPIWAIRSSGVNEDGEHSFAGQYDTILNVRTHDALFDGIRRCWASYFSSSAIAYRKRLNVPDEGIAVIVQTMLSPKRSGVLFGINPISGSWQEMVVESHPGLGEQVVGGKVIPDNYRIMRPRQLPRPFRRFAARFRLRMIESTQRTHSPLLEKDLITLCREGLKAERRFGGPQDIEWAQTADGRIWILQSRPITSIGNDASPVQTIWTRQFMGERWTVPATELGWGEMESLMKYFIDYPDVSRRFWGGTPPLKLHERSPYVNATIFRHLVFKLPGREATPPFMLELMPPKEAESWRRRYAGAPNFKVYLALLRTSIREKRWRRFKLNPLRNNEAWEAFVVDLQRFLSLTDTPIKGRRDALMRLESCRDMARSYLSIHVCSLLFANIWVQMMRWRLTRSGYTEEIPLLIKPDRATKTQEMNADLRALGLQIISLDEFMLRYGDRSANSWSLFSSRFSEEPEQILALARAAALAPYPTLEGDSSLAGVGLSPRLKWMLEHTQKMLFLREEQRFYFDRLLMRWRETWMWLEAETNIDLRHLPLEQALDVVEGKLSPDLCLLEKNRESWICAGQSWARGKYPPSFLSQHTFELDNQADSWHGVGISPGVVEGPVRLIFSIEQLNDCLPGDILVANTIEPGWTSVFLTVSGVALDLGGMLSHGAVVAREYGVPGVAGLGAITRHLKNGDRVGLDGAKGLIWRIETP